MGEPTKPRHSLLSWQVAQLKNWHEKLHLEYLHDQGEWLAFVKKELKLDSASPEMKRAALGVLVRYRRKRRRERVLDTYAAAVKAEADLRSLLRK